MVRENKKVTAENKKAVAPIEQIRKYMFRALLDDLAERERLGLSARHCDLVKSALSKVASAATDIPDGSFFRGTILSSIEDFNEIYNRWNGHEGVTPEDIRLRKIELRRLRKSRQRMSKRIHINQFVLSNNIDLALIEQTNKAFIDLVKSGPDIFENVLKTLKISGVLPKSA